MTTPATPAPLTVDPNPPIPIAGLVPPLTDAQRATMYAYMAARLSVTEASIIATINNNTLSNPTEFDTSLIQDYTSVVNGGGFGSVPGSTSTVYNGPGAGFEQSIQNFLGDLTNSNTWIRIGEFVFGGILLAIGVAHLMGGSVTGAAKSVSPVSRVSKAVS